MPEYEFLQKINNKYNLYGYLHDREIRDSTTGEVVAAYNVLTGRHRWDLPEGGLEKKL